MIGEESIATVFGDVGMLLGREESSLFGLLLQIPLSLTLTVCPLQFVCSYWCLKSRKDTHFVFCQFFSNLTHTTQAKDSDLHSQGLMCFVISFYFPFLFHYIHCITNVLKCKDLTWKCYEKSNVLTWARHTCVPFSLQCHL